MAIPAIALVLALVQQPAAPAPAPEPELAVLSARLGPCSADFTVKDAAGQPVYSALIHVRIRYGFMSIKRMDLEVGTNSAGKARVEGLPEKAKPLNYDITKGDLKASVDQDLASTCKGAYEVTLK